MQNESTPTPANGTKKQVAEHLQVCLRTVENYVAWGLLKPVYFGDKPMFPWSQVRKLERTGVSHKAQRERQEEVTA